MGEATLALTNQAPLPEDRESPNCWLPQQTQVIYEQVKATFYAINQVCSVVTSQERSCSGSLSAVTATAVTLQAMTWLP